MAWKVDTGSSCVDFLVKHLRITNVRGRFSAFDGTLDMNEQNPQASTVEGTVDIASLRTGIGLRDSNLRGAGRFDAKRFPRMHFKSTRISPFEGDRFKVYGNLTIKDITRPIVVDVIDKGEMPPVKGEPARRRHGFDARVRLNRKDFGIKWNPLMELGNILVANDIDCTFHIEFIKEPTPETPDQSEADRAVVAEAERILQG